MRRSESLLRAGALLSALALAGCSTPGEPASAAAVPWSPLPEFSYRPAPPEVVHGSVRAEGGILRERLGLSWEALDGQDALALGVTRFRPPQDARSSPVVLILPILSGGEWIVDSIAESLARGGFECLVVRDPEPVLAPGVGLARLREALVRRVIGARRVLDWWSESPGVDPSRIGLVGVSLGAVVGALLMEADPRPAASALVLGGGNLPLILERSREREVREFWRALLEKAGGRRERLREEAAAVLQGVDPLRHARRLAGRKVLMIHALFDRVVPPRASAALWTGAGRPERVVYPVGHHSLTLFIGDVESRLAGHFEKGLQFAAR